MDLGITDRVAIVGGASQGLGRAAAEALAREGVDLTIFARTEDRLTFTARELAQRSGRRVHPVVVDVTRPTDLQRAVDETIAQFGRLDILVNNAGGPPLGTFASFDDDAWQKAFELSLLSVVRLTRLAIPHMQSQQWGRVINIVSFTVREPAANLLLSNSVRMGVVGLAKSLSRELAPHILVNNAAPGRFATERMAHLNALRAERTGLPLEEVERGAAAEVPLGRAGRPEEFGDLVAFLASERASYITGQTVLCDGGFIAGV